jgi:D-alanyl-D-alanine carboxypeptidase/D-alanyl-D-alanine-endopeptidase (penicillin-binding protein 4)
MKNSVIVILSAALAVSLAWNVMQRRSAEPAREPMPPAVEAVPVPEAPPAPPILPPPPPDPYAALKSAFDEAAADPALAGAAIGCCVIDSRGEVVLDRGARTALIPASTFKTLTTATALEMLGPDFRFETAVGVTQTPVDGILNGDIVIRGGGDPMLARSDLDQWAAELVKTGLKTVKGRVIGDGRLFRGSLFPDFWNWGDIGNGFGSPVSGLNCEHNRFAARFQPGAAVGDPSKLDALSAQLPGIALHNEVVTGPADSGDGVMIHGGERAAVISFRGTVPLGGADFMVTGAITDPERFAADHFRQALAAAGITVEGGAAAIADPLPEVTQWLIRHPSPPLADIVASIHATSDNLETECVFRAIGLHAKKAPELAIREHWAARGLDFTGLRMVDGSGLARANHITPYDLAKIQFLAGKGPVGEIYRKSLTTNEPGTLRWKAGAMSAIRGYTGYAASGAGGEYCFALIVNHHADRAAVDRLRDALWERLLDPEPR